MKPAVVIWILVAFNCIFADKHNVNDNQSRSEHILNTEVEKEKRTSDDNDLKVIAKDQKDSEDAEDMGCVYTSVEGYVTRWLDGGYRAQTTIDKCKRFCETSGNKCWGFDRDESRDRCYFFKTNTWEPTDQYVKQPCDESCDVQTYTKLEATFSPGGRQIYYVHTADECKEHCSKNKFCLGFDFDNGYYVCYEHYYEQLKAPYARKQSLGGSFYQRIRGQGSESDTFKEFKNRYSEGFIFNSRVPRRPQRPDDLAQMCKESCLKNENCEGVNVDFDFMVCQHVIKISVQVYEKGEDSEQASGKYEYIESDVTWSYSAGVYWGDNYNGYNCQLACSVKDDCVAVSYSRDVYGCWIYSSSDFEQLKNMAQNIHYRKQC